MPSNRRPGIVQRSVASLLPNAFPLVCLPTGVLRPQLRRFEAAAEAVRIVAADPDCGIRSGRRSIHSKLWCLLRSCKQIRRKAGSSSRLGMGIALLLVTCGPRLSEEASVVLTSCCKMKQSKNYVFGQGSYITGIRIPEQKSRGTPIATNAGCDGLVQVHPRNNERDSKIDASMDNCLDGGCLPALWYPPAPFAR